MIGNDVVDLRDPDADPTSFRPRFDTRVFGASERAAIDRDPRPGLRRWAHWAAKEAAYKALRRVDRDFVFAPSRLVARFASMTEATPIAQASEAGKAQRFVRRGELLSLGPESEGGSRRIALRCEEWRDGVHVVAWLPSVDPRALLHGITRLATPEDDASAAARALALDHIAARIGCRVGRLAVGRRGRIPTLEIDGEATASPLSLSHHGCYVGFAWRADSSELARRAEARAGSLAKHAAGRDAAEPMRPPASAWMAGDSGRERAMEWNG